MYFSGTGNTELISEKLSSKLKSRGHLVELVSIENLDKIKQISLHNKTVIIGFPVYKLTYPDILSETIEHLKSITEEIPLYLFSTYARFESNAINDFILDLNNRNVPIIGYKNFKSPSCGISARKDEDDYEYKTVMFFEDDIEDKLNKTVDEIEESKPVKLDYRKYPPYYIRQKIVKNIELTKYPKLQINHENCKNCGICLTNCPEDNFYRCSNNIVNVKENKYCLHCLRCMNHCPVNAISFGKLTIGNNQYTKMKRDELFNNAVNGKKEIYWKNFDQTVNKWRRNTLSYWMKYWFRPEI